MKLQLRHKTLKMLSETRNFLLRCTIVYLGVCLQQQQN
jgi:hypothetical protein